VNKIYFSILIILTLLSIEWAQSNEIHAVIRRYTRRACQTLLLKPHQDGIEYENEIFSQSDSQKETRLLFKGYIGKSQNQYFSVMTARNLLSKNEVDYYSQATFEQDLSTITSITVNQSANSREDEIKTTLIIFSGQKVISSRHLLHQDNSNGTHVETKMNLLPWERQYPNVAQQVMDRNKFKYVWEVGRVSKTIDLIKHNYILAALEMYQELRKLGAKNFNDAYVFVHATTKRHKKLYTSSRYGFKQLTSIKKIITVEDGSESTTEEFILYAPLAQLMKSFNVLSSVKVIKQMMKTYGLNETEAFNLSRLLRNFSSLSFVLKKRNASVIRKELKVTDRTFLSKLKRKQLMTLNGFHNFSIPIDNYKSFTTETDLLNPYGLTLKDIPELSRKGQLVEIIPTGNWSHKRKNDVTIVLIGLVQQYRVMLKKHLLYQDSNADPNKIIANMHFLTITSPRFAKMFEGFGFKKLKNHPNFKNIVIKKLHPKMKLNRLEKDDIFDRTNALIKFDRTHKDELFYTDLDGVPTRPRNILMISGHQLLVMESIVSGKLKKVAEKLFSLRNESGSPLDLETIY